MKLDFTLERVLTVWWAFAWRSTLVGGVAGFAVGFVGGFILGAAGSPELGRSVGTMLGWIASIPCSIWAFREALRISYRDFEVAFLADVPPGSTDHAVRPPTASQSAASPIPDSTAVQHGGLAPDWRPDKVVSGLAIFCACAGAIAILFIAAMSSRTDSLSATPAIADASAVNPPAPRQSVVEPSPPAPRLPVVEPSPPTTTSTPPATPPAVDTAQISNAVSEFALHQNETGGLRTGAAGAAVYSQECFQRLQSTKRWVDLDFCFAFDDAARNWDAVWAEANHVPRMEYFDDRNTIARQFEIISQMSSDISENKIRLKSISHQVRDEVVRKLLAQTEASPDKAEPSVSLMPGATSK